MYRAACLAKKRAVVANAIRAASLMAVGVIAAGCASISAGPTRLYAIDEEAAIIKNSLREMNLAEFTRLDEAGRMKFRNDWLAGRMYAMDMQYTAYEAALTRERQSVGFGAALATIGLTTASTLVSSVATKDILTGTAGAVTGARAAYDNDIMFAHGVQWIQSQMRARRADISSRIIQGMKASTVDYPLAAALSDLEAYYRAGTFTGGLLATSEVVSADARASEEAKQDAIQVTFGSTPASVALRQCFMALSDSDGDKLIALTRPPTGIAFSTLVSGARPDDRIRQQDLLARARAAGLCP